MRNPDDVRDQVLQSSMPMVMAPVFGQLPTLAVGAKRLIAANDGIYIEMRTPVLWACQLVQAMPMPYGQQQAFLNLKHGPMLAPALSLFMRQAAQACPNEHAAMVVADQQGYDLQALSIASSTPVSVTYCQEDIDDDALVIDIHSHGDLDAFFSNTDDESDLSRRGPYIAVVVGKCRTLNTAQSMARLVSPPYLIPLDWRTIQQAGYIRD